MAKPALRNLWLCLALVASPAAADPPPSPAPPAPVPSASPFGRLWTGWAAVSADSLKVEQEAVARVRQDYASA
nr:hypothetical protein [Pseudomonadota bacterium]